MAATSPLKRIVVPKASDLLASQLRAGILAGDYVEGDMLPNERDLSERSGLSRTSVREALRILEVEGLVVTRPGRNGGSAIRRPGREAFRHSLSLFIWGQKVSFDTLLEVRETIEPAAARFAAANRDDEDLAAIDRLHQELVTAGDDIDRFRRANVDWHGAIVQASHNLLLVTFYETVVSMVHEATDAEGFHSADMRRQVIHAHERITEAVRERDGESAARRMFKHMDAYGRQLRRWVAGDEPPRAHVGSVPEAAQLTAS